jgi:hypothetical protein
VRKYINPNITEAKILKQQLQDLAAEYHLMTVRNMKTTAQLTRAQADLKKASCISMNVCEGATGTVVAFTTEPVRIEVALDGRQDQEQTLRLLMGKVEEMMKESGRKTLEQAAKRL